MAESILPALSSWWRSLGQSRGDGASLPRGASTTPYDDAAVPSGPRRFTFEITYSADRAATLALRVNWFSSDRAKVSGPFDLASLALDAAQGRTVVVEVTLPDDPSPRWLPSVGVTSGSDEVLISSLKVYEMPPALEGPAVTVWNGSAEIAASVAVWDGAKEIPATIEIQA